MSFTPNTDELLTNNAGHVEVFDGADRPGAPTRNLAVVTCMDCRVEPLALLGIEIGEAHILRNAGGVVTDDVIRSLCLSQRFLGTREIVLVHHSACGLQGIDEAKLRAELQAEVGVAPAWAVDGFADAHDDVRQSMRRLETSPFLAHKDHIRGFVYDVANGGLDEVLPT